MSRKQKSDVGPITVAQVDRARAAGEWLRAVQLAQQLVREQPDSEHLPMYRHLLLEAGRWLADAHQPFEFTKIFQAAEQLPADAAWTLELAVLQARAGNTRRALALVEPLSDPAAKTRVIETAVDRAIRRGDRSAIPDDCQAAVDAYLQASAAYTAGQYDEARAQLNKVGITSPVLEWKLFLRGLIAHQSGDHLRALENWQRLAAHRVPYRLCLPLRLSLEPGFLNRLPPDLQPIMKKRCELLTIKGNVAALQELERSLSGRQDLAPAFTILGRLAAELRASAPRIWERLGQVVYSAIDHHGHPGDLVRHRRLFGEPKHDPDFLRLKGEKMAQNERYGSAYIFWSEYLHAGALRKGVWPQQLTRAIKALVHRELAELIEKTYDGGDRDELTDLHHYLNDQPQLKNHSGVQLVEYHLRQAFEYAPEWNCTALSLVEFYKKRSKNPQAIETGLTALQHQPTNLQLAQTIGNLLLSCSRSEEAMVLSLQARAQNPLDRDVQLLAARSIIAVARRRGMAKSYREAESLLLEHRELCEQLVPVLSGCLRATLARVQGRRDEADALEQRARAASGAPHFAIIHLAVNATLLKLKPAEKKPYTQSLEDFLKLALPSKHVIEAYNAFIALQMEGLTYTGQITLGKKLQEKIVKSITFPGANEEDCEQLLADLAACHHWDLLLKASRAMKLKRRANPTGYWFEFIARMNHRGFLPEFDHARLLDRTRHLASLSPEPRHKALLTEIDQFMQENY